MSCVNHAFKDFLGRFIYVTVADSIPGSVAVTVHDQERNHGMILALMPSEARLLAQSLNVYARIMEESE